MAIEAEIILGDLESEPENDAGTWEIEVLAADPAQDLPAVKFEISYFDPEDMNLVTKKYRKPRQLLVELTPSQQQEVRCATVPKFVRGWTGLNMPNFRRMSKWALRRPQLIAKFQSEVVGDDGKKKVVHAPISVTDDNLKFVAKFMDHDYFNLIANSAMDLNEAGTETLRKGQEKKG